jgi:MarR family transcriptional regulator, lower aerobic nicotinate degradation pathway regulator
MPTYRNVGGTRKCCYARPVPEPSPHHVHGPARIRDRPTWLISRTYARSHRLLNDGFTASGTGLRSYHYRLLAALEEWGPIGQADLGRSTNIDRSDVVSWLGELEQRGLTERTINPNNRRRNIVAITPAGRRRLRTLDRVIDEIQERVLAPLSQNERTQLTKLLRKLADAD